ncbi:hypothetical protein LLEC1_02830 [Akanthomyces lecanii]|uniref:BTB domain-containing protein n=1 Tax=Cordyceps confragosa TaxID=2714763 RepID=A0A179I299_CORDF|nr:hypothetical protein LLEC1_02830 [Akanthomyces lecanii]
MAAPWNLLNSLDPSEDHDDDEEYSDSSSDSSSDESSLDEPPTKTRTRRSNELACSAATNTTPEGTFAEPFQSMMIDFVLAAQCSYFKDALTKGGLKKEAVKEFHFDKGPAHAYWRMLEYLYKGTYSAEPVAEFSEPGKYLVHH